MGQVIAWLHVENQPGKNTSCFWEENVADIYVSATVFGLAEASHPLEFQCPLPQYLKFLLLFEMMLSRPLPYQFAD